MRLRRIVYSALVALPTFVLTMLRTVDVTSSAALGRIDGMVLMLVGMLAAGRWAVHLRDRYWQWGGARGTEWTTCDRRRLNWLVGADGAIALAMLGSGATFFVYPHNWMELAVTFALMLAMIAVSVETIDLAGKGGLPRGSETIGACWAVRWIRKARRMFYSVPGVRAIDELVWERHTDLARVSGLVIAIVLALAGGTLSQAVAVAPQVKHYLSQPLRPKDGRRTSADPLPIPASPPLTTPVRPSAAPASPAPAEPSESTGGPTYEDLCGTAVAPGDGVSPASRAIALAQVWLRLGGAVAGCAQRALLVSGTRDVYYVAGECDGQFRSLGVVGPDRDAAVLLDEPALFAHRMAGDGRLRGASPREPLGDGDFQIVYTSDGAYVLVRREVTDGHGGVRRAPERCTDVRPAADRYVVLPPALAELWLKLGGLGMPTWPVADRPRIDGVGTFRFYDARRPERVVATGWCTGPTSCVLLDGRGQIREAQHDPMTVERVLAYGPS